MAAGSRSARGVAGEAAPDGHVPNYNIFGQQHHRLPTKDLSHLAYSVKEKPEWTRTPRHRTRSDMMLARRAVKHPDLSYDLDGDGAVGPTDYFIGKQFSQECDHRLNTGERREAVHALESGYLDTYSFGHEQAGAKRPFPVKQVRGKIISVDNVGDLSYVYPPHWNADKEPRFKTATDLAHHRRGELRNAAGQLKADFDETYPAFVPEPPVPREPTPFIKGRTRQARIDARKRETREYGGLEPENTHVNPHREMQPGTSLNYHEVPHDTTRSAMLERRHRELRENLHESRRQGETDYVPMIARHTWRDDLDYENRRPNPEADTLTKLKHRRKVEGIEHNMSNFERKALEHPRYADQSEPWWKLQKDFVHEPAPRCALQDVHDPVREVTGKVTESASVQLTGRFDTQTMLPNALLPSNTEDELAHLDGGDHRTLQRWSTEFVPQGVQQHAPRYFDGVKQAPTYSMDTAELDQFSSFEVISKNAIRQTKERQARIAREDEERAHAWKLSVRGLPDASAKSVVEADVEDGKGRSNTKGSNGLSGTSVVTNVSASRHLDPQKPPKPVPPITQVISVPRTTIKPEGLEPQGEDPPMTQRLERIAEGRSVFGTADEHSVLTPQRAPSPVLQESPRARRSYRGSGVGIGSGSDVVRKVASIGAGSRRGSYAPSNSGSAVGESSKAQGMVVRTGGFQWVDRNAPFTSRPSLLEAASNASLLGPPKKAPSLTQQETPPRSRSVSRTRLSTSVA